jgi:Rrf2 family transcriptional regulator, nitric oxide-sensitive transcriptional repressor
MRLTYQTDYTLRVLLYLANLQSQNNQKLANIQDIAETYSISENHLMKIVHKLGKLGYLETVRGRGGGVRLAREPHEIIVGHVVRHTEEESFLVECFNHKTDHCPITADCQLRSAFIKAMAAFLHVLDGYTLADISHSPILYQQIIQVERRHTEATKES